MSGGAETDLGGLSKVLVVERSCLLRDCLAQSLERDLRAHVISCSRIADLAEADTDSPASVLVLSLATLTRSEIEQEFEEYARLNSQERLVVLAKNDDSDAVLASLDAGAYGHISVNAGLPAFVAVLRFVAAGGTYVPPQSFVDAKQTHTPAPSPLKGGITRREFAVIKAIRMGKPNKQIAYELSMCENTVKVHVRNVMRKLHVHNRTEIAVMGARIDAE